MLLADWLLQNRGQVFSYSFSSAAPSQVLLIKIKRNENNQMKYHSLKMREKGVLEVGAGTGLASLIAARCGAGR